MDIPRKFLLLGAFFVAGTLMGAQENAEYKIYVATDGNDANLGTYEKPVASFSRAKQLVREAKQKIEVPTSYTVVFKEGIYYLNEPIVFRAEDSGISRDFPVRYVAEKDADVVISGGGKIGNWVVDEDHPGLWKTKVSTEGDWRFEQLWVNNERAVRARTPNDWEFRQLVAVREKKLENGRAEHMFWVENDIADPLKNLSEKELYDINIHVYHKWDTTRERIKSVDVTNNRFGTEGRVMAPHNSMVPGSNYYLENYFAALDAPKEWFLDRNGWLYYMPSENEKIEDIQAYYPKQKSFMHFEGNKDKEKVHDIEFYGLKFRNAEYRIPEGGVPPMQAAMNCNEAAIELDSCTNIQFSHCAVEEIGTIAFWFRHDCHNCRVDTSRIADIGASAVRIGETQMFANGEQTEGIVINNCIMQSGGRIHPSAVGVWIGHSSDNQITHNEISDFFYTGVSVGWTWGYSASGAQRNLIAYNHLHHIGYKILSDMGGIYTLGYSAGTALRGNLIHDIYSSHYGGWGLYPDEGTTEMVLENNLVYNTKDGGFHQHYGKENIVRNNIFAFSDEGQIAVTRSEPHLSFTFQNNIVVFDKGSLLGYGGWAAGAKVNMNSNLFWNVDSKEISFAGKTFEEWKKSGRDQDSLIADPLFKDVRNRDFHLADNSPTLKIGFKPFDFSKAGVYGDPEWIKLANSKKYRGFGIVKNAGPLAISSNFEDADDGYLFNSMEKHNEGKDGLIEITDKYAASGKYSIKLQDDPNLHASFNPHFYVSPSYVTGTVQLSYNVLLEPGIVLHNEFRTEGAPYIIGPSLLFKENKLYANGKELMDVPCGKWIGVEVTAQMGDAANGKWNLKISNPDGGVQEFKNLDCSPQWNRLKWLGFCALENTSSVCYIDDISLEVKD